MQLLGFVISSKRIRCLDIKLQVLKRQVRQITCRSWGISMEERLEHLRLYVNGWLGYFAIGVPYKDIRSMDQWLRRCVRLCYWKLWRLPCTLPPAPALGINPKTIKQASRCRKGYWRCSKLRGQHRNEQYMAGRTRLPLNQRAVAQLCYPNG